MSILRRILKPATWGFYLIIVFEILFMISPFGLYFYSVYGPVLNFLNQWSSTAWLTQFFLPHISQTDSPLLNALHQWAGLLILIGAMLFFAGAIPIYWAKFQRRGAVTGGLYRLIRHPKYLGLAIVGLGTTLLWPRFLILITFVTMLFLYVVLARWEEEQCLARFGDSYRAYQERTGMFLPRRLTKRIPRLLPLSGGKMVAAAVGLYAVLMTATVLIGFKLRDYSVSQISAFYSKSVAVLSPARLTNQELITAYRTAVANAKVQQKLKVIGSTKLIVYVVPVGWYLADLPMEVIPKNAPGQGHNQPVDFDRRYYKLLFTTARTYVTEAMGKEIVKTAYGRNSIMLVKVDISTREVTGIEKTPPNVEWGDIPTPLF
jgi:protein-S-isoprenylcysteine O-methyltransferase Ste14